MGIRTVAIAVLLAVCASAHADLVTFNPFPSDALDEMDANRFYSWGIDTPWGPTDQIVSATLSFKGITDMQDSPSDILYVRLLNDTWLNVIEYTDHIDGDDLYGLGVVLPSHVNISADGQDIAYHFTTFDMTVLGNFARDGRFGIGLDSDGDYHVEDITLEVQTLAIPEPAAMSLLSVGAVTLVGLGRRKRFVR